MIHRGARTENDDPLTSGPDKNPGGRLSLRARPGVLVM